MDETETCTIRTSGAPTDETECMAVSKIFVNIICIMLIDLTIRRSLSVLILGLKGELCDVCNGEIGRMTNTL